MGCQILIIEDELEMANAVKMELDFEGYEVTLARDGITGLNTIRQFNFDLILLDWKLPDLSGLEICRRLRQTAERAPIIFTTVQSDISDRVRGLDAGADDYLTKPFSVEELLARVRSNLRRAKDSRKSTFKFADLQLDLLTREVERDGRSINLTTKEFELLKCLIQHPFQVLSRRQLLEQVWDYNFVDNDKTVEVHIRHLRRKLEANGEKRLIQTVRGMGYALQK